MTDWINYTLLNGTTITQNLQQTDVVLYQATGYALLVPLILITLFFGAAIAASKFGYERSMLFASIFTLFVAFILTAATLLNPMWLILMIIIAAIFYFAEA